MASNFPIFHGINLANNSVIENLHLERLVDDPAPVQPGRLWFNLTTRKLRFSTLNATGEVVIYNQVIPADLAGLLDDSKAYTDGKISELIGQAPDLLNTLNELASALGNDENFSATVLANIAAAKASLLDSVSTNFDTLKEVETALNAIQGSGPDSFKTAINTAVDALQISIGIVDGKVTIVSNDVVGLTGALVSEVTRATAAEGVLTTDLATEVTRATAIEAGLRADLTSEITRADTAEKAIADGLAAEIAARGVADTAVDNKVIAETARAIAAEQVLTTALAAELVARAAGDEVNAAAITTEKSRAEAAESGLSTAVQNETSRATGAEGLIATDLSNEVARATGIEGGLRTDLTNESNRAIAAEGVIAGNLTTEAARALAAEGVIADGLTAEATRADTAEKAIVASLADEVARATAKENLLDTRIDNVLSNIDPVALNSLSEIVAAFTTADSSLIETINSLGTNSASALAVEQARALAAEAALGTLVSDEAASRVAGDVAQAALVTAEQVRALAAEVVIADGLAQELLVRAAAVDGVAALVTAEAERAIAVEGGLNNRITTVEGQVNGKIGDLTTLTTDNKTTIVAALNEVDAHADAAAIAIDAEQARAIAAEAQALVTAAADASTKAANAQAAANVYADGAVAAEATLRTNADTALGGRIDTEMDARVSADAVLTTRIVAEETNRASADTVLDTRIGAEESNRAAAVTGIRNDYNARNFTFQSGVEATTHIINHNLGADFVTFTVLVERADGKYRNDIVSVEETTANTLTIYLSAAAKVKVAVQSMTSL